MALTAQQLPALKAAILAETDPTFVTYRTNGQTPLMTEWLNGIRSPAFYVKRTVLSRHEILTGTSDDGTTFTWTGGAYITRSQGERDAFREIFNSTGTVNPSLPSITAAFNDIFSGAGGLPNRTHILAMSRRPCTRAERIYATGTGSKADPAVAVFDGVISDADIGAALSLP